MKKMKMVTGKLDEVKSEKEVKDLNEIIYGAKASKFGKWKTAKDYENELYGMTHIELCEEVMRVGETPSSIKETCRKKCLDAYERSSKPRKITHPEDNHVTSLEEIIKAGKKAKK